MGLVRAEQTKKLALRLLKSAGVPAGDADIAAEILTAADLRGIDSHGIARLPIYVRRLRLGLINKKPQIDITARYGSVAAVDGDNGLGQVVAYQAMSHCIGLAKQHGIAAVGVSNSNHFGIGAYYAMMGLEENLISVVLTNTSPLMAPFGGREALLGTNPIAVAVPAADGRPIVLDMATSLVTRGRIEIAARRGEQIPPGWALDIAGRPAEDPVQALAGTLLPVGGPKGYGLSLMVDVLAGLLTGAAFGSAVGSLFGDLDRAQNVGHFMLSVDPAGFGPPDLFRTAVDGLIDSIKNSPPAEGTRELFLPGEIEYLKMTQRRTDGWLLDRAVTDELLQLSKECGLVGDQADWPDLLVSL